MVTVSLRLCLVAVLLCNVCASAFNFISIGDWGKVTNSQKAIADQMAVYSDKLKTKFFLILGDNFYEDGVASETDPQWNATYRQIYSHAALQKPWFVFLGNHDHHFGRGAAQIDYYKHKRDDRWVLPDYFYSVTSTLETGETVQFLFIDTVILCDTDISVIPVSEEWPEHLSASGSETARQARELFDLYRSKQKASDDHWTWVKNVLVNSTADWLFVGGHYPVYSGGEHGDTKCLKKHLNPMLREANVDAYFSGHDHTAQHLQSHGVNYWLSGSAAKKGTYSPVKQTLFGMTDAALMTHQLYGDSMTTQIVGANGKVVYKYTQLRNPKRGDKLKRSKPQPQFAIASAQTKKFEYTIHTRHDIK